MKLLNTFNEDYHVHSMNYSDGMNTIDEMVQYAGKIGMKKLVFTDHSQHCLDRDKFTMRSRRSHTKRWKNLHNEVEVVFGVEGDLINDSGDCCFHIQGQESDFCILSAHSHEYEGNMENLTQAYIQALKKYHQKIACLGHLNAKGTVEYIDLELIIKLANEYNIPVEFNAAYFVMNKMEKLDILLGLADQVYVNGDTHCFVDLENRRLAFEYLKEKGFIS